MPIVSNFEVGTTSYSIQDDVAYAHAVTNKGSAFSSGLYKITTNSEGHVTAATAVEKSDITALGVPTQDTTYSNATASTAGLMSAADKTKLDGIATGATADTVMTGATSNVAGTSGLVPAPTTTDVNKFLAGDGTYKSGGLPMVILKYGISTWADFEAAYNNNVIVYCRTSSNSDPSSGSQTRMAFMAYVNNESSPTEVEFQYYRSYSGKSNSQVSDNIYIYKLNKTNGWSVSIRYSSAKQFVGSGIISTNYANNNLTISSDIPVAPTTDGTYTLQVTVTNGTPTYSWV